MEFLGTLLTEPKDWDYKHSLKDIVTKGSDFGTVEDILLVKYEDHTYFITADKDGLSCKDVIVGKPSDVLGCSRLREHMEATVFIRKQYLMQLGLCESYASVIASCVKGYVFHDARLSACGLFENLTIGTHGVTLSLVPTKAGMVRSINERVDLHLSNNSSLRTLPLCLGSDLYRIGNKDTSSAEFDLNLYADLGDQRLLDWVRNNYVVAYSPVDNVFGKLVIGPTRSHLHRDGVKSYCTMSLHTEDGERIRITDATRLMFTTAQMAQQLSGYTDIEIRECVNVYDHDASVETIPFEHLAYSDLWSLAHDSVEVFKFPNSIAGAIGRS